MSRSTEKVAKSLTSRQSNAGNDIYATFRKLPAPEPSTSPANHPARMHPIRNSTFAIRLWISVLRPSHFDFVFFDLVLFSFGQIGVVQAVAEVSEPLEIGIGKAVDQLEQGLGLLFQHGLAKPDFCIQTR